MCLNIYLPNQSVKLTHSASDFTELRISCIERTFLIPAEFYNCCKTLHSKVFKVCFPLVKQNLCLFVLVFLYFRMKILSLVQQHGNGLWNMCFTKLLGLIFYLLNTLQKMAAFCSLLTCLTCIKFLKDVEQVVIKDCFSDRHHSCYLQFYLVEDKAGILMEEKKRGFSALLNCKHDSKLIFFLLLIIV